MSNKIFSGINELPSGDASSEITEGCLVLEGGAFRGVYSEGVLDAMMEEGINLSCTIGVSAGAMNGMNYVSGQIGRSARFNLRYRHNRHYVGLPAIRKNEGLIGFDFAFEEYNQIDPWNKERFYDPNRRFLAVATNVLTGKPEYFDRDTCSDILRAIRASASMPYISRPVLVDHCPCLDGGCSEKIPLRRALEQHYKKIVVVRTRDESFRRDINLQKSAQKARFYKNYPSFATSLIKSNLHYNKTCDKITELKQSGRIFVFAPSVPVTVSRLEGDMEKLGGLYYLGYSDAKRQMAALKEYLSA